jgi:3-oxoacyl-[acyl-carrier protein] reductase
MTLNTSTNARVDFGSPDTFRGKTALVTGAGGALGDAIVRALCARGARVVMLDRQREPLEKLQAELPGSTDTVVADLADPVAIDIACADIETRAGGIDILVNNAGMLSNNKLRATTIEEWRQIHAVNLDAPFLLMQRFVPGMVERRWGRVINISSYAWKSGGKTSGTAYSSSKAGLVGLTFTVAKETAEFGVTVNGIAPAYVMSPMVTEQLTEEQRHTQLEAIPVKRFCTPEEIAHSVLFLASPLSAFITGEIVDMNGGFQFD